MTLQSSKKGQSPTKHKKAKRLLNLLRYKRHKKIRESICSSRRRINLLGVNYNPTLHQYYLKKYKLPFYHVAWAKEASFTAPLLEGPHAHSCWNNNQMNHDHDRGAWGKFTGLSLDPGGGLPTKASVMPKPNKVLRATKKKYKIDSYLFNVICKFPRKYLDYFMGKEIWLKNYTMSFPLAMSRFISNKVLRGYYQNLSSKSIRNLRKKIWNKRLCEAESSTKLLTESRLRSKPRKKSAVEKKENAKNFVQSLEERLDSCLLRLLHFKSLYTTKRASGRKRFLFQHRTIYPKYKVKSPWSSFSSLQIKQLINHGHIQVNGKKVKSGNIQIKPGDLIKVKGFIEALFSRHRQLTHAHKLTWLGNQLDQDQGVGLGQGFFVGTTTIGPPVVVAARTKRARNVENSSTWKKIQRNHNFTMLLRCFKDQSYLTFVPNEQPASKNLYNYIKGLKIKHFTEAFYITYRNMHLISRPKPRHDLLSQGLGFAHATAHMEKASVEASYEYSASALHQVEKHVQPVFDTIGYNQSIYLLWPVVSLLHSRSWNTSTKLKLIQFHSSSKSRDFVSTVGQTEDLKKLQHLLRWKKLQQTLDHDAEANQAPVMPSQAPSWNKKHNNIVTTFIEATHKNPSWLDSKNCYASIVYGTRKSKWIKLQQGTKSTFYNKIYTSNQTQFFELELEFFQHICCHSNRSGAN